MFFKMSCFYPSSKTHYPVSGIVSGPFSARCFSPELFGSGRPPAIWHLKRERRKSAGRRRERRRLEVRDNRRDREKRDWREDWKGVERVRSKTWNKREDIGSNGEGGGGRWRLRLKVEWVKKQNELTVPSRGKALVPFVWRPDCYLLDSRLLSSSLPPFYWAPIKRDCGGKRRQRCWGRVEGEKRDEKWETKKGWEREAGGKRKS